MLKILQQQSAEYFRERNKLVPQYQAIAQENDKVKFLVLLLANQDHPDGPLNFVAEATIANTLNTKTLLTAVWAYSLQLSQASAQAKGLCKFVGQLHGRNFVERSLLLSQLPEWVVQDAGVIEAQALAHKIKRVYTKINYQQGKHSLARQSNEGYSKLVLMLMGIRNGDSNTSIWNKMLSLVGNFDLDPDRVLDLIVQASLQNCQPALFVPLLCNFKKQSAVLVIGNRIKIDKTKPDDSLSEKSLYCGPPDLFDGADLNVLFREVPFLPNPKLIELTARCIKNNLFTYSDLLPYLQPSDFNLRRLSSRKSQLMTQKINQSFTLSMVQIQQSQLMKIFNQQNLQFQGQLLYSPKLALINQLVKINNWIDFSNIWTSFKFKFDLILYQPLLHSLLDLLQWAIDHLMDQGGYQRFFKIDKKPIEFLEEGHDKQFKQLKEINQLSLQKLTDIMSFVGRYIGFRTRLFIKLCRLFKRIVREYEENISIINKIKELTKIFLVPANGYAQSNGPMAIELFSYIQGFDYQFRYQCYLQVYKQAMTSSPYAARIFESIKRRQNIVVNNLSKDNKKLFGRRIAKMMHNQALPVLYWIARRIVMEDYEAVVPQIVSVLSSSTPLTLDMTIFVMMFTLNQHKEGPVNIKTHQFQPWFKNVITFISNFFRRYLDADIQPVFDYILMKTGLPFEQLEQEDQLPGALLKLLHQLLNKMHGSVMIEEVNKNKFDAIAAGPKLQAQILELSSEVKAAKKSKIMLQKFFWEQNKQHQKGCSLAFNLLILLTQKRAELCSKAFIDNLKILADIYDDFTLLIMQLVRVLFYQAQDFSHYALLLPANPLSLMLRQYKVPLQLACQIVRPGVKHIAAMQDLQWNQLVTEFTDSYRECLADDKYLRQGYRPNEKINAYLNTYKARVLEFLPATFFTCFWFLTIDSVYFPAKSYADKIEDVKVNKYNIQKKIQQYSRRSERDVQRTKTQLDKLIKQEQQQRKKYEDTLSEANLGKLQVDLLKNTDREKQKKENSLLLFAQAFVQVCLLPRMMLDRAEAIYCVRFTTAMIRANKVPATKSIRLVSFIIEYVMNYLPFTTHRQASNCISVFLAQILAIFINWNDPIKLKQDLKKNLGHEDSNKDNYLKLRDYLIRLFERVGNIIKSIKEEPYIIKNCLYLLEKVDSIPGYKEQADQLTQHMTQLKQLYTSAVDMRTILDRQIAMLGTKKNQLPEKPEEKKIDDKKPAKLQQQPKKIIEQPKDRQEPSRPRQPSHHRQTSQPKQVPKAVYSKSPLVPSRSPIKTLTSNISKDQNSKPNIDISPHSSEPVVAVSSISHQIPRNQANPSKDKNLEERKAKLVEQSKQGDEEKNKNKAQNRFSDKTDNKITDRNDSRFTDKNESRLTDKVDTKQESRFSDRATERRSEQREKEEPKGQTGISSDIKRPQTKVSEVISAIPPPKRLADVKRQHQLLQQGLSAQVGNQGKDNSLSNTPSYARAQIVGGEKRDNRQHLEKLKANLLSQRRPEEPKIRPEESNSLQPIAISHSGSSSNSSHSQQPAAHIQPHTTQTDRPRQQVQPSTKTQHRQIRTEEHGTTETQVELKSEGGPEVKGLEKRQGVEKGERGQKREGRQKGGNQGAFQRQNKRGQTAGITEKGDKRASSGSQEGSLEGRGSQRRRPQVVESRQKLLSGQQEFSKIGPLEPQVRQEGEIEGEGQGEKA